MSELTDLAPLTGIDWGDPIQSQYSASPRIITLAQKSASKLDNLQVVQDFYQYYLNPGTAQGEGLDDWARIVGLSGREITVSSHDIFGFYDQLLKNFDQGTFYGNGNGIGRQKISDNALRQLIFIKAKGNISGCSLADINSILAMIMQLGGLDPTQAYAEETGNMQITVHFLLPLSAVLEAIIQQYGLFVVGAGVNVIYEFTDPEGA